MGGARALTSHWMPAKTCEVGEVGAVSAFCIGGVRGSEICGMLKAAQLRRSGSSICALCYCLGGRLGGQWGPVSRSPSRARSLPGSGAGYQPPAVKIAPFFTPVGLG